MVLMFLYANYTPLDKHQYIAVYFSDVHLNVFEISQERNLFANQLPEVSAM